MDRLDPVIDTQFYNHDGQRISSPYAGMTRARKLRAVIITRILSVLAAIFLVSAFAVASIWPPDMLLKTLLGMADPDFLPSFQSFMAGNLPSWAWTNLAWPLLQRPAWLLPTAIGLVLFGGAISLSGPKGSRTRPRRWRG